MPHRFVGVGVASQCICCRWALEPVRTLDLRLREPATFVVSHRFPRPGRPYRSLRRPPLLAVTVILAN